MLEVSIGGEKRYLPLCAYVVGFGKSGHNYGKISNIGALVIWWMEGYEANSLWIECCYHDDVSKSLSLGLNTKIYHHLSSSGFT